MMTDMKFFTKYMNGSANVNDLDEHISQWHDHEKPDTELYDYLGLTRSEYIILVENPEKFKQYLYHLRKDRIDTLLENLEELEDM